MNTQRDAAHVVVFSCWPRSLDRAVHTCGDGPQRQATERAGWRRAARTHWRRAARTRARLPVSPDFQPAGTRAGVPRSRSNSPFAAHGRRALGRGREFVRSTASRSSSNQTNAKPGGLRATHASLIWPKSRKKSRRSRASASGGRFPTKTCTRSPSVSVLGLFDRPDEPPARREQRFCSSLRLHSALSRRPAPRPAPPPAKGSPSFPCDCRPCSKSCRGWR